MKYYLFIFVLTAISGGNSLYGQGSYQEIRRMLNDGDNELVRQLLQKKLNNDDDASETNYLYSLSFLEMVDTTNRINRVNYFDSTGLHHLDIAIELDPQNVEALLKRSEINSSKYKFNQVKLDVESVLSFSNEYPWEIDFYHAIAIANTGESPMNKLEAIKILHDSRPTNDSDKFRLYRLTGMYYQSIENHSEAVKEYSAALRIAPDNYLLLERRGDCKLSINNVFGALLDFKKARDLFPETNNGDLAFRNRFIYRINMQIGKLQLDNKKYLEAIRSYSNAIESLRELDDKYDAIYWQNEIDENLIDSYVRIGDAYYLLEDLQNACSAWNKASNYGVDLQKYRLEKCK